MYWILFVKLIGIYEGATLSGTNCYGERITGLMFRCHSRNGARRRIHVTTKKLSFENSLI